jgi:hypothetical protein
MKDGIPLESTYMEHLEEYVQTYWTRLFETPKDQNPALDPNGSKHKVDTNPVYCACDMTGEGRPVFRTLNITSNQSIFIPANDVGICDREHPGENADQLKHRAQKDEDSATHVKLTIDNEDFQLKDVKDRQFRIGNPIGPFEVVIPNNPLDGLDPPGKAMAVADGYYVIIKPFVPGQHTIRIEAGVGNAHKSNNAWNENITYTLNVR